MVDFGYLKYVVDNGLPIHPWDRKRLFDLFNAGKRPLFAEQHTIIEFETDF